MSEKVNSKETMKTLGNALFSETQQKLFSLLYGRPEQSFYTNEILRKTGMGVATIKRELDGMLEAGIITRTKVGNQHHYQANPACPIYDELLSIVKKTFGLVGVLQQALLPLAEQIRWSFIFGSVASGKESSHSDIDLIVIGDLSFSEVVSALYSAQQDLRREINPKIYSKKEWHRKLKGKDAFICELMAKPRMDVMGKGNEFGESARQNAGKN